MKSGVGVSANNRLVEDAASKRCMGSIMAFKETPSEGRRETGEDRMLGFATKASVAVAQKRGISRLN